MFLRLLGHIGGGGRKHTVELLLVIEPRCLDLYKKRMCRYKIQSIFCDFYKKNYSTIS